MSITVIFIRTVQDWNVLQVIFIYFFSGFEVKFGLSQKALIQSFAGLCFAVWSWPCSYKTLKTDII